MKSAHAAIGLHHVPGFLGADDVAVVIERVRDILKAAPLRTPSTMQGQALKLRVTSAGAWGWWSDVRGYRYIDAHPTTGAPWPAIPPDLLAMCARGLALVGHAPMTPDSLLINHYDEAGSLGLHIDRTEDDLDAPIVSLSIGADAVFLVGGHEREDKTTPIVLSSGDLLVQSGVSRSVFHGIKKLLPTMTSPLPGMQRINLTFRKVRR